MALSLKNQILDLQADVEINDFGLYNVENPAQDSLLVSQELKATAFTLNNSVAKGQKIVNDMTKLLLRAFNAEAVARLGKSMDISIEPSYLRLRERELELTHKHLEALKVQKKDEWAERERQRDEAQTKREFERVKATEGGSPVPDNLGATTSFWRSGSYHTGGEPTCGGSGDARRFGRAHVYSVSTIGAFGEGVVKIGMTRRLKPEDRIRELDDASVPSLFDLHAVIFSPDAVWALRLGSSAISRIGA